VGPRPFRKNKTDPARRKLVPEAFANFQRRDRCGTPRTLSTSQFAHIRAASGLPTLNALMNLACYAA
jgi:hypothetical protein